MRMIPTAADEYQTPAEKIIADPLNYPIQPSPSWQAVRGIELRGAVTPQTFEAVLTYIMRPEFNKGIAFMVLTDAIRKDPNLTDTKAFIHWAKCNASSILEDW